MNSPFGTSVPVLAERGDGACTSRERWLLVLVLLLGLGIRTLGVDDPWSGSPNDFHSAFGGGSTGGPARNFYNYGFSETLGVPMEWRVELEDGSTEYSYYPHHPTTCISITALSMMFFGPSEWASRLPWILFSMLSVFGVWRVARLIWNPTVALVAALFTAVMPFSAYFASMQWIDGLTVALYTAIVYRYVLWLRTGQGSQLRWASFYALLSGLCEWSAIFILPGLGLHALILFGRKRQWRALFATLLLPAGTLLGFAVHAIHLRVALPPDYLAHDTQKTLAWVTTLGRPLDEFLSLQWTFFTRHLTPAVAYVVLIGGAWAIWRALSSSRGSRLSREEGVLLPFALAGFLYVAVFPARSVNHVFFAALSVPFFGIISSLVCLALYRAIKTATSRRTELLCSAGLLAIGLAASVFVSQREVAISISASEPVTWLFLPLVFARILPWVGLVLALIALLRGARSQLASAALFCALSGTIASSVWSDIRFWTVRRSFQVGELVDEPWMRELLDDPRAVVLTAGNITMPLQFYSSGPVITALDSLPELMNLKALALRKLGPGRKVVFLYETAHWERSWRDGRLNDESYADLTELHEHLRAVSPSAVYGDLEVFDLTEWSGRRD